jgi:uncharacterized integral membrane protein
MRIFTWLLRGFLFLLLIVLALQNTHPATVYLFFGTEWRAPMMLIVLTTLVVGTVLGVLAMLPRVLQKRAVTAAPAPAAASATAPAEGTSLPDALNREVVE